MSAWATVIGSLRSDSSRTRRRICSPVARRFFFGGTPGAGESAGGAGDCGSGCKVTIFMTFSLSARPHPAGFFLRRGPGAARDTSSRLWSARAGFRPLVHLGLLVTSGVGGIACGRVASKARRGPGAALGTVLRGKIVVELVTSHSQRRSPLLSPVAKPAQRPVSRLMRNDAR